MDRLRAVCTRLPCLAYHKEGQTGSSKWTLEIAGSDYVNTSRYEKGLGRIMYVAGALEYEKPFLGPLYRFLALHPRGSIRRVPPYIAFILTYLSRQVSECRHFPCAANVIAFDSAPRVDAQASSDRTGQETVTSYILIRGTRGNHGTKGFLST